MLVLVLHPTAHLPLKQLESVLENRFLQTEILVITAAKTKLIRAPTPSHMYIQAQEHRTMEKAA